jgi:outer membrane receptor protein involved in Fe transport
VNSYPSILVGGCGNAQMGPEHRWQFKDDFSHLMHRWGGRHQWKAGFDISFVPFEGDNTQSPLGSWTFPVDRLYNVDDAATYPTQYTNSLPTYANIPTTTMAAYFQDDWRILSGLTLNLGLRYDLQRGVFNEDIPELLQKIEDKLGRGGSFPLDVSVVAQPKTGRGDFNNFGPRLGIAWDPANNGITNIHGGYGMFYDNIRTLTNFGELTWPQAQTIVITRTTCPGCPTYPDPFGGRTRESFLSTAPPTSR